MKFRHEIRFTGLDLKTELVSSRTFRGSYRRAAYRYFDLYATLHGATKKVKDTSITGYHWIGDGGVSWTLH